MTEAKEAHRWNLRKPKGNVDLEDNPSKKVKFVMPFNDEVHEVVTYTPGRIQKRRNTENTNVLEKIVPNNTGENLNEELKAERKKLIAANEKMAEALSALVKENSNLIREILEAKNVIIQMQKTKMENDAVTKEQIDLITFEDESAGKHCNAPLIILVTLQ